jgi:prepilin-type N-terminal cleavage/methylation domain-containing protein
MAVASSRRPHREREGSAGVTIPELLVVVSIIGLAVAVSYSMVLQTIGTTRVRAAAGQFAMTVKAVRMVAVTQQGNVDLVIEPDPLNRYRYVDVQGRERSVRVPSGVKMTMVAGPSTLTFRPNGSVASEVETRFEFAMPDGSTRGWFVTTNLLGVSSSTPFTE